MRNNNKTTPTIHHDYRLEVEPSDQATIKILARRWNLNEGEMVAMLLSLALNRWGDVRPGEETRLYLAELERTAAVMRKTNAVSRSTHATAA